ncbi:MAG: BlaI/MecI/CopY family transcriptional regulator [Phycisphaerae bacterium]
MATRQQSDIRLGKLESKIMNIVWDRGKATVHDVRDAIATGKSPAYCTILTMMRNLEGKGYLAHEVDDRAYVYRATVSQRQARRSIVGELLERLFEGSPAALVNSLIEHKQVSPKELKDIRKILKKGGYNDESGNNECG